MFGKICKTKGGVPQNCFTDFDSEIVGRKDTENQSHCFKHGDVSQSYLIAVKQLDKTNNVTIARFVNETRSFLSKNRVA
jgi:hypothetical protein